MGLSSRRRKPLVADILRSNGLAGRVVAVLGFAGAGRSTLAAQLAVACAARHPAPAVAVDASGSLWPGLPHRLPTSRNRELDWTRLSRVLAATKGIPVCQAIVDSAPVVDLAGLSGDLLRLGGVFHDEPFTEVDTADVLRAVTASRDVGGPVFVDCPADLHAVAVGCAVAAEAAVVVCRADPTQLRQCARMVELLSDRCDRDLAARTTVVVVQHRSGPWPRAAAAAEAAAEQAAAAVVRMAFDAGLASAGNDVSRQRAASTETASYLAALIALLAT